MEVYLAVGIVALVAILFKSRKRPVKKSVSTYRYRSRETVMTRAESRFYENLIVVVGEKFIVIPQAHLSMFIDHRVGGQNWKAAFSTINGKSVDFLLVEKDTLKPVIAIELDDWSHKQEDRILRDEKVRKILDESEILLVRFDNPDVSGQAIVDTVYQAVRGRDLGIQK